MTLALLPIRPQPLSFASRASGALGCLMKKTARIGTIAIPLGTLAFASAKYFPKEWADFVRSTIPLPIESLEEAFKSLQEKLGLRGSPNISPTTASPHETPSSCLVMHPGNSFTPESSGSGEPNTGFDVTQLLSIAPWFLVAISAVLLYKNRSHSTQNTEVNKTDISERPSTTDAETQFEPAKSSDARLRWEGHHFLADFIKRREARVPFPDPTSNPSENSDTDSQPISPTENSHRRPKSSTSYNLSNEFPF